MRRRIARSSWRASPAPAVRRPRDVQGGRRRDRDGARRSTGMSGARRARSTSSSTSPISRSPTSAARSTSSRRPSVTRRTSPCSGSAVRDDVLSAISTDHCAFLLDGQKTLGKDDFSKIPNGAPGPRGSAEDDPPLRRQRGPDLAEPHGRAPLDEPGEALRPLPAQGHDRPGLATRTSSIFDPNRKTTISAATQHSKSDYNLYEGTEVTGDVDVTLDPGHDRRRRTASSRSSRASGSSSSAPGSASSWSSRDSMAGPAPRGEDQPLEVDPGRLVRPAATEPELARSALRKAVPYFQESAAVWTFDSF